MKNVNSYLLLSNAYPDTQYSSVKGYGTNNLFKNTPGNMYAARDVISTMPEGQYNEYVLRKNKIKSNNDYRAFLQTNSEQIKSDYLNMSATDSGGLYAPTNSLDFTTPFSSTHPQQSDLKSLYLTREELHKKKTPTHLTQSEIFDISLQE